MGDLQRLALEVVGPVRARRGNEEIDLGPAKQRAVLALLLLNTGTPVNAGQIIDFVWGEAPPATAANLVQTYVKRLRQAIEPGRPPRTPAEVLRSAHGGYLVDSDVADVDLVRFRRLAAEAEQALLNEGPGEATGLLFEALSLFRGPPLADCSAQVQSHPAVAGIELELIAVVLRCAEAVLSTGESLRLLPLLERFTGAFPLHEPLHAALMRAHWATGSQAEALEVYVRIRQRLHDELGVDPTDELRRLHQDVLDRRERMTPDRPASLPGAADALGIPAEPLIGRDGDLERIGKLVRVERLVTLTGPGGVGKTALALALLPGLAKTFPDGIVPVELGGLPPERKNETSLVVSQILAALGVRTKGREHPTTALVRSIGRCRVLLVLDNAEHVVSTCARVVQKIVRACPMVTVLVTSRRPLDISGESVWEVAPLAPDHAVRLFRRRAAQASPDLALAGEGSGVADLCARLDGLPLALELAAARLRTMSVQALLDHVGVQAGILARGTAADLPHQRALNTTIAWSHRLLSDEQRLLLSRFAVFAGPVSLGAIEQVCGDPPLAAGNVPVLLSDLASHSLVQIVRDDDYRYRLLVPIREYARETGDPADLAATRDRHLAYHGAEAAVLARADPDEQAAWIARMSGTTADLFAALAWAFDEPGTAARLNRGVSLLADARPLWEHSHADLAVVVHWTEQGLTLQEGMSRAGSARLQHWAARAAYLAGRADDVVARLTVALDLLDDADSGDRARRVDIMLGLAVMSQIGADPAAAEHARATAEAARRVGRPDVVTPTLADTAVMLAQLGHLDEAEAQLREAVAAAGGSHRLRLRTLHRRTETALHAGRFDEAGELATTLLDRQDEVPDLTVIAGLLSRGLAAAFQGRFEAARSDLATTAGRLARSGYAMTLPDLHHAQILTEWLAGRPQVAWHHVRECLWHALNTGERYLALQAVYLAAGLAPVVGRSDAPQVELLARACLQRTRLPPLFARHIQLPFTTSDGNSPSEAVNPPIPRQLRDLDAPELVTNAARTILGMADDGARPTEFRHRL